MNNIKSLVIKAVENVGIDGDAMFLYFFFHKKEYCYNIKDLEEGDVRIFLTPNIFKNYSEEKKIQTGYAWKIFTKLIESELVIMHSDSLIENIHKKNEAKMEGKEFEDKRYIEITKRGIYYLEYLKYKYKYLHDGKMTELLYKHLSAIFHTTTDVLEKIIIKNENEEIAYKNYNILQYECFIFTLVTFSCRLNSIVEIRESEDEEYENIFNNLFASFVRDYTEINEFVPLFGDEISELFYNRLDIYEPFFCSKDSIDNLFYLIAVFFHIIAIQFCEGDIINNDFDNFMKTKKLKSADPEHTKILYNLILEIYKAVDLFFNNGFKNYLKIEENPSEDFLKKEKLLNNSYYIKIK